MSKLAEKIRKATRLAPTPIGFGSAKASSDPSIVLAGLARDAGAAADLVRRGADAVIVGSSQSPASASGGKSITGAIAGAWIPGREANESKQFAEGGFDFVIFDPNTAAATSLLDEEIGYVIKLPADLTDNEVRTLESFNLDAILIEPVEGALTVRRQIDLRRIYAMTRKPLIAQVNGAISVSELQALRDANVAVVLAEGGDDVERLRKTIDALPPRARRKDGDDRPTPLVPRAAAVGNGDDDDDE